MVKNKKLTPTEFKEKPKGSDQFGNLPSDFKEPTFNVDNQQVSKAYYDARKAQMGFSGGGDTSLLTNEEKAKLATAPVEPNTPSVNLLKFNQETEAIKKQELMKEVAGNGAVPTEEQLTQQAETDNPLLLDTAIQQVTKEVANRDTTGEGFAETGARNVAALLPTATAVVLDIIDNLRAFTKLGGADTKRVQEARGIFAQSKAGINLMIDEVAAGNVDKSEAIYALQTAYQANAALQKSAKDKGVRNLRYWLSGGKDIEVEANLNAQELARQLRELNIAIELGRTAKLKTKYGIK